MLKTRLILVVSSAIAVVLLFQLPKVVVENESGAPTRSASDSVSKIAPDHIEIPAETRKAIAVLRNRFDESASNEKNAIFADSLASLYQTANQFDSAGWFAEKAAEFFGSPKSWMKAANSYYQAYTLALNDERQAMLAQKAQDLYGRVLSKEPANLEAKTKMAMTYLTSPNPMQGITLLREVLKADPKNELALFNMGMLSIQSGQNDRAVERLEELIKINPDNVQGRLLLGVAYKNLGDKERAREQFETVKKIEEDPAVQATVDSYLKEL